MAQAEKEFDGRPDPDALLALANQEKHGKLRVFLGAAPGVGKTYAMLARAHALKAEGVDIVIGLAVTHGRRETEILLEGQEILPVRKIVYHGITLEEFDVDAALARKPKLIVVDELAHTNAPDSRHPKRWQDVDELLKSGVDVWSALNIQHLESLADVISRTTGVAVRETVPDQVLLNAADIILVDITPDELIQQLNEGKVYVPEAAKRATENYFTLRNLTTLRELALRFTAERVDSQVVEYLRQSAIEGPWSTSERLLVCVGPEISSEHVVREAARLATNLNASWIALYVEKAREDEQDVGRVKHIDDALRLAERLGGRIERLSGDDLVGEVLRFARQENITQIVLGRRRAGFLAPFLRSSLTAEIVRRSTDIAVHVLIDDQAKPAVPRRRWHRPKRAEIWSGLVGAALSVAVTVGAGHLIELWLRLPNLSLIFLVPVVACAVTFGLWSAMVAAVLSFFAFGFFFTEPRYQFTIPPAQEFLALLVFLVVAITTGTLASRMREHSLRMRRRMLAAQSLFQFSREMSGATNLDEVLWAAAVQTQKALDARCIVLLVPDGSELNVSASWPPVDQLAPGETTAARWALEKSEPAGWRTGTLPSVRFQFRPLRTTHGTVGVCGIEPKTSDGPLTTQDERTLTSILEQASIAIDRSLLVAASVEAAALVESEKLRTTLLSSPLSGPQTPLVSIIEAAKSLRQLEDKMPEKDRRELLASVEQIEEQAGRLSRFVANLLDRSRIESGTRAPRRDLVDVTDVVRTTAERFRKTFPAQRISIILASDLPRISGDASILPRVLFKLLDNARKYGGLEGARVFARRHGGDVVIIVTDQHAGGKPTDDERVFEEFSSGGRSYGPGAGMELGLSICRSLVETMGGTLVVESPTSPARGTRMVMRFPIAEERRHEKTQ